MSQTALSSATYRRDLGDGLVLRWSTAAEMEGIIQLYSFVFRDNAEAPLNENIAHWTRDMMGGQHPLITAGDCALVEDTAKGGIVAATCLLWQPWEYAGIRFPLGRP